jgi:5-hydroxyisourate hydrolase
MSTLSTHVLDTANGRPAAGVAVTLERQDGAAWEAVGAGVTDADGRVRDLLPAGSTLSQGDWRLTFDTGAYFSAGFYPQVTVVFRVADAGQHHHVPLLLSPYGYATYRGS